ncbi:hypothetical protein GRZ55_07520 [Chelativorans sp. ZYF759]|uniref:hypothetical protein n=1 Tax=Chelativorans sp. ZYF759 TaxID=2692213 RepID=UPI00145C4F92|nr:hypothetical protein [Chelativorans sp. ZYF759]NMG39086.1 hypothetical protein [Chelativorans sp. ZYF759]
MEHGMVDIDAMIREEKRLEAAENHGEAWADAILAGIEPEIIAEAALATAVAELVKTSGEDSAVALLERIRDQTLAGEFHPERRDH